MEYERKLVFRLVLAIFAMIFYNVIFYESFRPLTIWGSYFSLSLFESGLNVGANTISAGMQSFEFVHACIASSAYFLLFILIISTKDIRFIKGMNMMLLGSLLILLMNIFRIDLLILASLKFGKIWFDAIHMIFWRFISTIYVALVWIFLVWKFKIRNIPGYSDIKELKKHINLDKRKSRR
ncbi:pacearchaeosortase [archaeon]|nr:pacearchaeosortase [archaeon]MBT6823845.1 pacearchaeosortase [archaeon]MBT7107120.1 pacearchaeosortase [archaeon]MBT7297230.1 pacearchaeosortase [archaeon]